MIRCKVSAAKLDAAALLGEPASPAHGARVVFLGVVRAENVGRRVVAVEYDAHGPLAERTLEQIAGEAVAKWGPDLDIGVEHRTGRLEVGEASVAVIVGSRHRDEGYLASRYVLEELKVRVPIWKKEVYEDGETAWLRGHALCGHADRHRAAQGEPTTE